MLISLCKWTETSGLEFIFRAAMRSAADGKFYDCLEQTKSWLTSSCKWTETSCLQFILTGTMNPVADYTFCDCFEVTDQELAKNIIQVD